MTNNVKIGQIGEMIAARYLTEKGYKIIEKNYRRPWGEIDLVCMGKDGILVFVEVKALKTVNNVSHECFTPEANMSGSKLKRVQKTAQLYANDRPDLIDEGAGWQIDLMAVEIGHPNPGNAGPEELIRHSTIRHYENL